MDNETKEQIRLRANCRCEYCGIEQSFYPHQAFHVEHIIAQQHRGSESPDNLALACHLCNGKKGPNLSGLDPDTEQLTALFNPRKDDWDEHFRLDASGLISGRTAIGRTTAYVLDVNDEQRIWIRQVILRLAAERA